MASILFNDGTVNTVASPGASAGATTIPMQALTAPMYNAWQYTFSNSVIVTMTADAIVGATSISVSAISGAIPTGATVSPALILTNNKPVPANRFANWRTMTKPIGDSATRQSDGALSVFVYRTDHGASFELAGIPVQTDARGQRLADYADRIIAWMLQGGQIAVYTEDTESNSYTACGLMPGTTPELAFTDRVNLEYTLRLSLINLAASPTRMVCHYV